MVVVNEGGALNGWMDGSEVGDGVATRVGIEYALGNEADDAKTERCRYGDAWRKQRCVESSDWMQKSKRVRFGFDSANPKAVLQ